MRGESADSSCVAMRICLWNEASSGVTRSMISNLDTRCKKSEENAQSVVAIVVLELDVLARHLSSGDCGK